MSIQKEGGFFMPLWLAGPWKGVSGEGRARRGESVIVVKKIDVHVNAIGVSRAGARKPENSVYRR